MHMSIGYLEPLVYYELCQVEDIHHFHLFFLICIIIHQISKGTYIKFPKQDTFPARAVSVRSPVHIIV